MGKLIKLEKELDHISGVLGELKQQPAETADPDPDPVEVPVIPLKTIEEVVAFEEWMEASNLNLKTLVIN